MSICFRRVALCVLVAATASVMAETVTGWRTDGTGKYARAMVPTHWGPAKNVLWKTPMPSWGNATPVVVAGKVFVCAEPATLLCVDAADGKVLWTKSLTYDQLVEPDQAAGVREMAAKAKPIVAQLARKQGELRNLTRKLRKTPDDAAAKAKADQVKAELGELNARLAPLRKYVEPRTHNVNGHSSPTPVTDGKHVWVLSGLGTAACFDLDGNRKWRKLIEKPTHGWGHSASPALVDGKLIVHVLALTALDAKTGEQLWRTPSKSVWGSPLAVQVGGVDVLILANGDAIRASDGKRLAKGLSRLTYATPTADGGVVYFAETGGRALKLPETVGDKLTCKPLWSAKIKKDRYYGSSLIHDGLVYAVTQGGHLSVMSAADGSVVYEKALRLGRGKVYPSPTLVGKHVLIASDNGTVDVIEAGREFKLVVRNTLEPFRSCPVAVGGRLYVRGYKHLYCIGE